MAIEPDGGDTILLKSAISDGFDQGSFACILQPHNGNLEFLVEEPIFDPVQ